MKLFYLLLTTVLFFTVSCRQKPAEQTEKDMYLFTSFHEPATDGLRLLYSEDCLRWDSLPGIYLAPSVGTQKIMRDPSMVQGPDSTFHLVWTTAWRGDRGFGYASSKDLINWSESRFIPVMEFDTSTVNVWAPELYYEDETGEFYVVWASTIPFKYEKGIEDEKNNHRLYYAKTKDFQTFSDASLLYDPGYSSIDAVIVKRAKSDYVLVLKDNTRPERNMKVAFASAPEGPYERLSAAFTPNFSEGPSVVKKGEEWLIFFDAYQDKYYGAVSTRDFVEFTDISRQLSIPEGHKHGTIVKVKEHIIQNLKERSLK